VDITVSDPIELAEYGVAQGLQDEPASRWWIHTVLRTRDRIITKAKSKYWRTTHKFDIRLPKTAEEAYRIDKATNTDFWMKAIQKELKKVMVAFEVDERNTIRVPNTAEDTNRIDKETENLFAKFEPHLSERHRENFFENFDIALLIHSHLYRCQQFFAQWRYP